jgi:hypothetical protein
MARSRQKTTETDTSFNPAEFDPAMQPQAAEVVNQVAAATEMPPSNGHTSEMPAPTTSHAASVERKTYTKPVDPFGFENRKGESNRVQLLKSEGEGAWVIRFAHNPNEDKGPNGETYDKQNQHPVLKMLKSEGFRWGFDGGDSKGGWGKAFTGDAYGQDHIDARRVLQTAAEMIGAKLDQGRLPD